MYSDQSKKSQIQHLVSWIQNLDFCMETHNSCSFCSFRFEHFCLVCVFTAMLLLLVLQLFLPLHCLQIKWNEMKSFNWALFTIRIHSTTHICAYIAKLTQTVHVIMNHFAIAAICFILFCFMSAVRSYYCNCFSSNICIVKFSVSFLIVSHHLLVIDVCSIFFVSCLDILTDYSSNWIFRNLLSNIPFYHFHNQSLFDQNVS